MAAIDTFSIISQLEQAGNNVPKDDASRKKLVEAARDLVLTLETPGDTYSACLIWYILGPFHLSIFTLTLSQPLQLVTARVVNELGLFETISNGGDASLSTKELADKAGVDVVLLSMYHVFLSSKILPESFFSLKFIIIQSGSYDTCHQCEWRRKLGKMIGLPQPSPVLSLFPGSRQVSTTSTPTFWPLSPDMLH